MLDVVVPELRSAPTTGGIAGEAMMPATRSLGTPFVGVEIGLFVVVEDVSLSAAVTRTRVLWPSLKLLYSLVQRTSGRETSQREPWARQGRERVFLLQFKNLLRQLGSLRL